MESMQRWWEISGRVKVLSLFQICNLREANYRRAVCFSPPPGRTSDSHGQGQNIKEPLSNPNREAKFQFAYTISDCLRRELFENKFARLIMIDPPLMLGDLRRIFSKQLSSKIIGEIQKVLTQADSETIVDLIADNIAAW